MQISRRAFLLTAAAAACSRRDLSSPLQRAAQYLWAQQAEDGGFHSATYGLLRSGQSLTPFVLDALLGVSEKVSPANPAGIDRALEFIAKHTNAEGALGMMDETAADYPNYATALAVAAAFKARRTGVHLDVEPMVAELLDQQFIETNGWTAADAVYGAWGMGGQIRRPPETGHVDLSMTRYVLEALRAAGVPSSDPPITKALVYLERSQNSDGGFYFSTANPEINKAGEANGGFASYGTSTADGLLALRAAGVPDQDARIVKAIKWLKNQHQPDRAPGFDGTARQSWASGLRFYYAYVISRTRLGLPVTLPRQAADGSFRNSNNMVKEDDPLIATTFAFHVLANQ
ncbi:MAG TPA: prenyltransferase/squalene oxidase repeat-containing protein [Terriglobia bacterium]|nr:prenyltransferase/squalene oxidase repeat-containing protein [Terriglobia bacterium]